ncbi:hypothetical protein QLX08_004934 [Tetragonisca angustula]|uniref:Uncharacterized protein n=1 Tax=Tetragonisca angustula TaxID=166442 RepID=A0AAW1A0G8_9HYME
MSASKDLNTTNIAPFNQKIPKKIYHPLKGLTENLKKIKKLKSNKDDLYQPAEINIRNIKKIKYLPTNFQKLMIPKNNTKLNCHFIKKDTDSSSILNTRKDTNIK